MANEENEDAETALWRRVLETLLARGASPAEAIEGANLVVQGYRRQQQALSSGGASTEAEPIDDGRETGMRRRPR